MPAYGGTLTSAATAQSAGNLELAADPAPAQSREHLNVNLGVLLQSSPRTLQIMQVIDNDVDVDVDGEIGRPAVP
ncbi:hypothetical protein CMUS01_05184 [Colletotrichum musicola]|uniref:Uncharacterized protein n=1 Tax=Colletotrichum musicola TaxID=2175873 RepID=A0A8H6NLC1_9PEZI|nr:hypothetical protein CMUS01_05184 [Colletotrichum musicola]